MKSDLTTSNGIRLIAVAPGSFVMGSPPGEAGQAPQAGLVDSYRGRQSSEGRVRERGRRIRVVLHVRRSVGASSPRLGCRSARGGPDDPDQLEGLDDIPPSLHGCIYEDRPEILEWLLDHGANVERREQDYGATPLTTAVVHRHKKIIRILVERGADATGAMQVAERGLAGDFEDLPPPEAYREIVALLRELGVG